MKILVKILLCVFVLLCGVVASAQKVTVKTRGSSIEISNGLLGVVIPAEKAFVKDSLCPAPIQSFIYSDGEHSDNSFNTLVSPTPALSMKLQWVTRSSSQVTVRITYHFQKKEFSYGKLKLKGAQPGSGFYTCELTVRSGEKSILVEEDADYDIHYTVKISDGLSPDQARYRGWSSASVQQGYESSGKKYRSELERGYPMDATVDLNYSKSFSYPPLVLWQPAGGEYNSGRYWQVFNRQDGEKANLFGFFQGKPSRLIGARGIGVQLQVAPEDKADGDKNIASIRVNIDRIYADLSWYPRKRFQWAAFISTKADLLSPEKTQPIGIEMNRVSGLGRVINVYAKNPVKLIPAFYKAAIYMPEKQVDALRERIKSDDKFYKQVCAVDVRFKPVFDAWRYADSAKSLLHFLLATAAQLEERYKTGEGTYAFRYRYWMGTNLFKDYAIQVAGLFSDKSISIKESDRKKLESLIAMMARIVWDDNNVPLFDSAAINFGPSNMAFQYRNNGRIFFALLLANDPEFAHRAQLAKQMINTEIEESVYANGSSFGSPHYIQATIEPVLFSMLQLKNAGVADLFRTNKKVRDFAGFYTTLVTPPSVRFALNRKLISFGDGSEESAPAFALLATGFANVDAELSRQLLSLFFHGPARSTLFGPISLAVDLSADPEGLFNATTANYIGYLSHFRSGVDTENETALWVLNGDGFYDHRNDDAGEMAIYALKAPLSLKSSSAYPAATDSRVRSVVIPEMIFPEWNKAEQPIAGRSLTNRTWPVSNNTAFANLGFSSSTTVRMEMKDSTRWYRKINRVVLDESLPIFVFYDSVAGKGANIWSMPMMSEGAVGTPVGPVTPEKKIHNNRDKKQLPEATPMKHLEPGLNRFEFTGQHWSAHPTGGINWELYTYATAPMDFTLSEWGTTWQNTQEVNEFRKTNNRNYVEFQQYIRLRSDHPFFNILLPYKKGQEPYRNAVKSRAAGVITVEQNKQEILLGPDFFYSKTEDGGVAALWSNTSRLEFNGISISGGYTELEYNSEHIKVRVHGNSGERKLVLPFVVKKENDKTGVQIETLSQSTVITVDYQAADYNLPNGKRGYREYIIKRK